MSTRKEDIKSLQEIQTTLKKIKSIDKALGKLAEGEKNVKIDRSQYNTEHVDRCKDERDQKCKQIFDSLSEKEKSISAKFWTIPVICILVGVGVGILTSKWLLAVAIAAVGFIIKGIISGVISKRISNQYDVEVKKIHDAYEDKLDKAWEEDEKETLRAKNALDAAREKYRQEILEERTKLKSERKECNDYLKKIQIISDDDLENIPALLRFLESNRADNIKEALLALDEEKSRAEEEKRRREEEIRRRKEEEAARLAAMPGKVHVRIGSINTYSGALQTVKNTIYFDGAPFGYGDATGSTVFQLNPGLHSVYAQLAEAGYVFTSPTRSFELPGSGDVYLKIAIKNARANIYLCSSESEFLSN